MLQFRRQHCGQACPELVEGSARATRSNSSFTQLDNRQAKARQSLSFRLWRPQWRAVFFPNILRAGLE
jgi:hypothetical protein